MLPESLILAGFEAETEYAPQASTVFGEARVMKPIHIGLLVVVGAIGGALVMKMTQPPAPVATSEAPAPAAAPAPPATAPPTPATAEAPAAVEPAKPSPVEPSKAVRSKVAVPKVVAKTPVKKPVPPPVTVPEPAKETASVAPPPPSPVEPAPVPPVRPEPEHVAPAPRLPEPPPEPHKVTLNAGMILPVRLVDGLSSERNVPGDTFTATLDKELVVDGFVIAERGARVDGKVVSVDRAGKVKGVAALAVEVTRLRTSDGQNIAVQTDSFERRAQETHKQDAAKVGGGAALGAIIGAIAGGGKGAAIGAATGGGAGAGAVLLTRGEEVRLTSETRINFRLRAPVTVTERR